MANTAQHPLVAVIWIDWYAYHVARFRGLNAAPELEGRVAGIELVGGIGVHAGLKFREPLPPELNVQTLEPNRSWREASQWALARKLWATLSELDPQVVLVPGYYTLPGIASALWARLHGAASVLMTESCAFDHQRVWWKEAFKSLSLHALFNWAVSGGKAHVEYLHQLGFAQDRIVGFYDVVDNDLFREGVRELENESPLNYGLPDRPYFLYVGRLAEEKNIAGLLESWLAYRHQGGSWPLVLVGDGPEAAALKQTAAASAFGADVFFPGLRSSRQLLPYYAFAGCFVLPSTREPWGLVVNEAMAAGLPVLVSDRCGCAPDLVEAGVNGFIFDPNDRTALTEFLKRVENATPDELSSMSQASVDIIRQYSPLKFGGSIASILITKRSFSDAAPRSRHPVPDTQFQKEHSPGGTQ